jgi:hypothetical protein
MTETPQTSKEYFRVLSILHASLMSAQLFFAAIVFYLHSSGSIASSTGSMNILFYVVPLVILGGLIGSSVLFKSKLKSLHQIIELKDKLTGYRVALLLKYAMLEGPSLFSIVVYFLTANFIFLCFTGLIIVVFLVNRPSPENAATDLELSPSDRTKLLDPNAIVAEVKPGNYSDD